MAAIRAFIAVDIPPNVQSDLYRISDRLQHAGARGVRWVSARNIHVTLKFLGDITPGQVPAINQAIQKAVQDNHQFKLQIKGVGAFPNIRRPRVIWVGIVPEPGLLALAVVVENCLKALGFPPEERPFSAHITLGRVSQNARLDEVAAVAEALKKVTVGHLAEINVEQVVLFRSELNPGGSIYTPIASYLLNERSRQDQ